MSVEIPTNTPEKKESFDDNARKFLVKDIDLQFLNENDGSSFTLIVDWLETGEENEKKVAYKKFDNDDIQILLILKTTKSGKRISEKKEITEETYKELLLSSIVHLEKRRHEFTYTQNDTSFSVKYDEFAQGKLCMMEVDASTEDERDFFDPRYFPGELIEATGNMKYYGYRMAQEVEISD